MAIPNLLRARMAANESSAASAIRLITAAEVSYYNTYPTVGYAAALPDLGSVASCTATVNHACLLDSALANATPGNPGHSGYQFLATGISNGTVINGGFVAGATPLNPGTTGTRDICSTTEGVLRIQPATGGLPANTIAACQAYPVAE